MTVTQFMLLVAFWSVKRIWLPVGGDSYPGWCSRPVVNEPPLGKALQFPKHGQQLWPLLSHTLEVPRALWNALVSQAPTTAHVLIEIARHRGHRLARWGETAATSSLFSPS